MARRLKAAGLSGRLNTVLVERLNLTLRQGVALLTRRAWSVAQQAAELALHVQWWRAHYHFACYHEALRVERMAAQLREGKQATRHDRSQTPAMAASLASRLWTALELIGCPMYKRQPHFCNRLSLRAFVLARRALPVDWRRLLFPILAMPSAYPIGIIHHGQGYCFLNLARDGLRQLGVMVQVANTGLEAVEQTRLRKPDIILMDVQMPVMDGLEAIRPIRAAEATRKVPILALTALAMTGDHERCLESGATEYVAKPVSLSRLCQLIRDLVSRSSLAEA